MLAQLTYPNDNALRTCNQRSQQTFVYIEVVPHSVTGSVATKGREDRLRKIFRKNLLEEVTGNLRIWVSIRFRTNSKHEIHTKAILP
jgi:hypothetical protein